MKDIAALLYGSSTPQLDARVLAEHARDEAELEAFVARRAQGEPVAQILGSKGFWTLELKVTRDVLCPRPDTETILDALLKHRPDKAREYRVLDLGTGSGCLVLSVLSEYPQVRADAVDVSEAALDVARENARANGLEGRVCFHQGEWCAPLPQEARYDIVVSNPPYIPTADIEGLDRDVREYEPHLALDGGADGLDCYRVLAKQLKGRMVPGGIALMEVGAGQSEDVADIMKTSGWTVIEIAKDLAQIARVVVLENQ